MADKEKVEYSVSFKDVVRDSVNAYRKDLNATNFKIDVAYMGGPDVENDRNVGTAMKMRVNRRYINATLFVYPRALEIFEKDGPEELKEIVAHEIAHLATQHMMDLLRNPYKTEDEAHDAWETLTTVLGNYIYNAVKRKDAEVIHTP